MALAANILGRVEALAGSESAAKKAKLVEVDKVPEDDEGEGDIVSELDESGGGKKASGPKSPITLGDSKLMAALGGARGVPPRSTKQHAAIVKAARCVTNQPSDAAYLGKFASTIVLEAKRVSQSLLTRLHKRGSNSYCLAEELLIDVVKAAGAVDPTLNPPFSIWSLLPEPMCLQDERVYEAALDTLTTKGYTAIAQLPHFVVLALRAAAPQFLAGCGYKILTKTPEDFMTLQKAVLFLQNSITMVRNWEQAAVNEYDPTLVQASGGVQTGLMSLLATKMPAAAAAASSITTAGAKFILDGQYIPPGGGQCNFTNVLCFFIELAALTGVAVVTMHPDIYDFLRSRSRLFDNDVIGASQVRFGDGTPAVPPLSGGGVAPRAASSSGGGSTLSAARLPVTAIAGAVPATPPRAKTVASTGPMASAASSAAPSPFRAGSAAAGGAGRDGDEGVLKLPAVLRGDRDMIFFMRDSGRACCICNRKCGNQDLPAFHPDYQRLCAIPPKYERLSLGDWLTASGGGLAATAAGAAFNAKHAAWHKGLRRVGKRS